MNDRKNAPIVLDPNGFNELRMCGTGPMLYNKLDIYIGGSLRNTANSRWASRSSFPRSSARRVGRRGGANIGAHTVELARLAGPEGEVHAFEPQRIVFQTLCANLALESMTNVFARQAAVGVKAGTIPSRTRPGPGKFRRGNAAGRDAGESVPLVTLDSLDLPACHFLKVDVEGMEVDVLKGAEQLIETIVRSCTSKTTVSNARRNCWQLSKLEYDAYWHFRRVFNPKNYFGDAENIFGDIASVNILCVPKETKMAVAGLRQVLSVHEKWNAVR